MPDIKNLDERISAIEESLGITPDKTLQESREDDAKAASEAAESEYRLGMSEQEYNPNRYVLLSGRSKCQAYNKKGHLGLSFCRRYPVVR